VSALQEKLGALPEGAKVVKSGVFDTKTLGGVLRWQKENKLSPSGIIAADAAAKLGLNWS
jgi:peptidoglycan hydrolase-like protein with peptidoglycan-binding domain